MLDTGLHKSLSVREIDHQRTLDSHQVMTSESHLQVFPTCWPTDTHFCLIDRTNVQKLANYDHLEFKGSHAKCGTVALKSGQFSLSGLPEMTKKDENHSKWYKVDWYILVTCNPTTEQVLLCLLWDQTICHSHTKCTLLLVKQCMSGMPFAGRKWHMQIWNTHHSETTSRRQKRFGAFRIFWN